MESKAQGSLEYILLLGGILLIVVLAIIILRGGVFNQATRQINENYNAWEEVTNVSNCTPAGC